MSGAAQFPSVERVRRTPRLGLAILALATVGVLTLDSTGVAARFPTIDIGRPAVEMAPEVESVRYDDSLVSVADYVVDDSAPSTVTGADPAPTHAQLWQLVADIWPADYLGRVRQFSIVREHPYDVVAVVHQSQRDTDQWILTIDEADATNVAVLTDTMVHELAHLITLDDDSFVFGSQKACAGVSIPLGCAAAGSIMADWVSRFWPDPAATPEIDSSAFVTNYAASAPHEDFAETFMVWVRGTAAHDDTTVTGDKLAFLDSIPALVEIRDELRANLADEISQVDPA